MPKLQPLETQEKNRQTLTFRSMTNTQTATLDTQGKKKNRKTLTLRSFSNSKSATAESETDTKQKMILKEGEVSKNMQKKRKSREGKN
jgi:hypothetical protein